MNSDFKKLNGLNDSAYFEKAIKMYNHYLKSGDRRKISFLTAEVMEKLGKNDLKLINLEFINHLFLNYYDDVVIRQIIDLNMRAFSGFPQSSTNDKKSLMNIYAKSQIIINNYNFFTSVFKGDWHFFSTYFIKSNEFLSINENFHLIDKNTKELLISSSINTFNKEILNIAFPNKISEFEKIFKSEKFDIQLKTKFKSRKIEKNDDWLYRLHFLDDNAGFLEKIDSRKNIHREFNYLYDKMYFIHKRMQSLTKIKCRFEIESLVFQVDSMAEQMIFTLCKNLFRIKLPEHESIDPNFLFENEKIKNLLSNKKYNKQFNDMLQSFLTLSFHFWNYFDYGQKYKEGNPIRNIVYHRNYASYKNLSTVEIKDYLLSQLTKLYSMFVLLSKIIIVWEYKEESMTFDGQWVKHK